MSNFKYYSAEEFLSMKLPKRQWLVEGLIRERDAVILVGNEKSGKSLFLFQLVCSLTTGHPFLDHYEVPNSIKVTYLQLEGELEDSQDRFQRLLKTFKLERKHFQFAFLPPLELQSHPIVVKTCENIEAFHKPDIVIIDPIYFAFMGKLGDDEAVRKFIGNLRLMKDRLHCAILLIHHIHKQRFDYAGGKINEGDEAMFGSKLFKAWADHTILFDYDKARNVRILSCNTQRSGDIKKECTLRLVEPDPLYFELMDTDPSLGASLIALLSKAEYAEGLTIDEICEKLHIKRYRFFNSVVKPLADKEITKNDGYPRKYRYNWEKQRKKD